MTKTGSEQIDHHAGEQSPAGNKAVDLDWKNELSRIATLIKEYWTLMGVGVLVLSILAMQLYLTEEGIPLSITSSDVIVGLPALFILIAFAVASLTGAAALPTGILLRRSKQWKRSLMDDLLCRPGYRPRIRFLLCWSVSLILTALMVVLLLHCQSFMGLVGFFGLFLIVVLLFFVSEVIVVALMLPKAWRAHFNEKWDWFVGCSFVQTLVMINLGAIVESQFPVNFGRMLTILSGSMIALSVFQVASASLVWQVTRKPQQLIHAVGIAAAIMLAVCTTPTLNRFFVGYVLASSAMGGRNCVVLEWTKGTDVLPELRREENAARSIDLKILMSTQSTFYARPKGRDVTDGTLLIPYGSVAKVLKCERRKNAPATGNVSS